MRADNGNSSDSFLCFCNGGRRSLRILLSSKVSFVMPVGADIAVEVDANRFFGDAHSISGLGTAICKTCGEELILDEFARVDDDERFLEDGLSRWSRANSIEEASGVSLDGEPIRSLSDLSDGISSEKEKTDTILDEERGGCSNSSVEPTGAPLDDERVNRLCDFSVGEQTGVPIEDVCT